MNKDSKDSNNKVSKVTLLLGLLIEIFIYILGSFLDSVAVEIRSKYLYYIICGIMAVYFIGRNYFFLSVSSVIMSIRWKKSVFILLKNCIYLALIIVLFLAEKLIIKLLAGLAINCDLIFMMIKGKWFLDKLFKIECYATGVVP